MNCKYYSYHEDASRTFSFPDPISQSEFRQEEARAQEKCFRVDVFEANDLSRTQNIDSHVLVIYKFKVIPIC